MSVITQPTNINSALQEIVRNVKTHDELAAVTQELLKLTLETCLKAELRQPFGLQQTFTQRLQ